MQYMSICTHEEFRRSERCGKMKVILSANTYGELGNKVRAFGMFTRWPQSWLFLVSFTQHMFPECLLCGQPWATWWEKGLGRASLCPPGLQAGSTWAHERTISESLAIFQKLVFLVAYQITTLLVWSQLHTTRLQLHITRLGQPRWNPASSS